MIERNENEDIQLNKSKAKKGFSQKRSDRNIASSSATSKVVQDSNSRNKTRSHKTSKQGQGLTPGDTFTILIRRLGINGEGVGNYQRKVVFVEYGIPGEEITVKVVEVAQNYIKATPVRWKKRSPYRVEAPCPVFGECGGCQIQHIHPRFQARLKRELVEDAFRRYTNLKEVPLEKTVRMQEPWFYRNKAQFPLVQKGEKVLTGLYSPSSHRLIDLSECPIQHPLLNEILEKARHILQELKVSIYDEKKHRGLIRYLIVRIAFQTKEAQIVLVTSKNEFPEVHDWVREVTKRIPEVVSLMQNVNPDKTSLIFGEKTKRLWGEREIVEKLGHLEYGLSARAFFQLNPEQTIRLYELVEEAAALTGTERVVDAYCGVGTIGLWLANRAKEVIGMDTIVEAIEDAKRNAERNGITNVRYEAGAAEELLPQWIKEGLRPDVVIADPPRVGLGEPFLRALIENPVKRLVYVSCNPSTLAKDADQLLQAGYQLTKVTPVDMFPQTSHVESIATFVRKDK
ncbi:23S rRNA (uracil(1939)-C(5))-methyltransferase RlmD [Risungbinella massiliensis]|uniref:23S rRNA (uracil(1939)-C(5))-methyltransferase RlmD n=1 Tax=Risungbinella massiliensis TaxID=1329796 RepID=UPI0009E1DAFE